jgi:hypothetical protein
MLGGMSTQSTPADAPGRLRRGWRAMGRVLRAAVWFEGANVDPLLALLALLLWGLVRMRAG